MTKNKFAQFFLRHGVLSAIGTTYVRVEYKYEGFRYYLRQVMTFRKRFVFLANQVVDFSLQHKSLS